MSTDSNRLSFPRSRLAAVVSQAYDLSVPVGMGLLHFRPGPLQPEEINSLTSPPLDRCGVGREGLSLDYVLGRAVKLLIVHEPTDDSFYLIDDGRGWYDHSDEQWEALKATARGDTAG